MLRIRRRSRMDRKHALEMDEICSEKVSDESIITPRLRAESVGVIETLEGIRRVGSEIFEICLGRPISRNSVLD